ncbi:hypothetical protein FMM05_04630 [Flavobacterium zepuense]|uniref:Uncharacterized protein n=1 Tax=Flavobacterium zepuense TaxID=2593302 RepID=A0A552V884_9FLAO|nr:hypothetical protein [Flavobacterium zepuense]TRW26668.1 hypothetical protein FMM05_04630 [Flavobacterium zepuense]
MKYIFFLGFILILNSCAKNSYSNFDYNRADNPWIDAFKDQAFITCLKESYAHDSIFKLIEKKDALNPYDGLSLESLQKARSLGKLISKDIPPPSMCENCTEGQNYYMATCFHYYKSKELDSIANAEYRKFLALK